jgi:hypothetical protein
MAEAAKKNPMMGMMALSISPTVGLEGFHDVSMGMTQSKLVVGVSGEWLVLGSSAEAVRLSRATAAGEHPNVLENETMAQKAILPKGAVQRVSFQDKSGTGEDAAAVLRMVSMFGPMSISQIPDAEVRRLLGKALILVGKLAPVVQRIDFYDSAASAMTFDGNVWRTRAVTHYRAPAPPMDEAGGDDAMDDRVGSNSR